MLRRALSAAAALGTMKFMPLVYYVCLSIRCLVVFCFVHVYEENERIVSVLCVFE
jgi:hypothetical protein